MTPSTLAQGPGYIRILGFRENGRKLLKRMKQTAAWPVVTSPAGFSHHGLERDIQTAAAYAGAFDSPLRKDLYSDYFEPPVMV
ncbi:hypothetical protein D3C74_467400 [compost metagenome]